MGRKIIALISLGLIFSSFSVSESAYSVKGGNFRWEMTLQPGEYLFNSTETYFFDTGVNCYLFKVCPDIDSVFESTATKIKITKPQTVKYQAYLFTDDYEYVFVQYGRQQGWLRVEAPIEKHKKDFLKAFLVSRFGEPRRTCYVEVVPFKDPDKVFISTTDDWYIGNIDVHSVSQIGTKGGRLEACRMLFHKNCVECYIDLGWGEVIMFDQEGKRCQNNKTMRRK